MTGLWGKSSWFSQLVYIIIVILTLCLVVFLILCIVVFGLHRFLCPSVPV
ncbi:hypothetical protein LCGC14_0403320 [marine sediment metagenome]|uniref:Uncharacterized protein n=1 Tax=marine sediment metagenome TaxID=412755 RepID=A0A0F9T1Q9_9ZZZZ